MYVVAPADDFITVLFMSDELFLGMITAFAPRASAERIIEPTLCGSVN